LVCAKLSPERHDPALNCFGVAASNCEPSGAITIAFNRTIREDVEAQGLFGASPISVLIGDDAHTNVFSALELPLRLSVLPLTSEPRGMTDAHSR
jgi:hypothetical protein